MKNERYIIYHRINDPHRILGLPLDEAIPILLVTGLFWYVGAMVAGFMISAVFFVAIRHFKQGQGSGWLKSLAYWFLPDFCFRLSLSMTPASFRRFWIS